LAPLLGLLLVLPLAFPPDLRLVLRLGGCGGLAI